MKRAVVTGASSGIGREIVRQLVAGGWKVLAVARRGERLSDLKKQLGENVATLALDITQKDAPQKVMQAATKELGGLDLLVNDAGCSHIAPFEKVSTEQLDKIFNLNVRALMLMCQQAVPLLEKSSIPQIINVGSLVAHIPCETIAAYCASKAAVVMFGQVLAKELAPKKIRVNTFSPTGTDTEIFDGSGIDRNVLAPAADMARMVVLLTELPAGVDVGELIVTKRFVP